MRIGTLNVHSGRGRDGRIRPGLLAAATGSLDCDVLALQEVDRFQPRSGGEDQAAVVAEAVGALDHRFVATVAGEPGGAWLPADVHDDGRGGGPTYGIALVSRCPVRSWRVLPLPPLPRYLPVRLPVPIPGRVLPLLVREEPRVALVAEVEGPHGVVTVATTHLSFVPGWNAHQLRHLADELRGGGRPVVLAGDLNLGPRAAASASGMRHLLRAASWPAERPLRQLDHLLGAGVGPAAVRRSEVVRTEVSDHRALVVDLELTVV